MNKNNSNLKWLEFFRTIIVILILTIIIKTFILDLTLIDGRSMYPTLNHKDRLLVNKLSFLVKDFDYNDIIVFKSPNEKNKSYIKRVIAKEGDIVEIKNNRVYVNNKLIEESYTSTQGFTKYEKVSRWDVGKGEVFVLGDNRPRSNDSRKFGPISVEAVEGIAFFRFYPFNKIGKV